MLLVDTSVWIEIFRSRPRMRLESVVDLEEVAICLPIIQEMLQGFRDERAFRTAREALLSLPVVESPMHQEVFEEAADLYRDACRTGLTVRSGVDCLIAACAIRHGLTVLHLDRDFDLIGKISELRFRNALSS